MLIVVGSTIAGSRTAPAQEQRRFSEQLRLPASTSSEIQFHLIAGAALQEDGSIFVLFRHEYLVVPFDANERPYRVTLPENILLRSVTARRVLGIHLDADRVPTIRVYQMERTR